MNAMMSWGEPVQQADALAGDRRFDRRYEIELELRWKLIRRRKVMEVGVGHTVDLSSSGIMFEAGQPLPVGMNVELSVSWPVLLHNVAPLQLVVLGRIVRTDGTHTALRMIQHEFRTMASAEKRPAQAPVRTPAPLLAGVATVVGPQLIKQR
jgi:hypothetical protein